MKLTDVLGTAFNVIERFIALCAVVAVVHCTVAGRAKAEEPLLAKVAIVAPNIQHVNIEDKNDITVRRLRVSDGLSQTRVSVIAQDDEGYVWFGTQHGVSRYDGNGYTVFKHDQADPGSLSGVFIYALFKDRDGTMWVGSDQFLDAFDRNTGTFRHYRIGSSNPTVIHISQDRTGLLWLSTNQGLFSLDPSTGNTKRFVHDDTQALGLSSSDIKSTGEDKRGMFWVATSQGLEQFDWRSGKVAVRIPLRQEVREFGFHEDEHGIFWIYYGSGNGLATYDRKTNTIVRYSYAEDSKEGSLGGVYSALETKDGEMWFATMGNGLLRYDRTRQTFVRYLNDPTNEQSLAEDRVIALFEDREGNIWTGLHALPPNVFPKDPPAFLKLWPFPHTTAKFGEPLVNTIFEDRDGNVWLGAGGSLNRMDRARRKLTVYHPAGDNVPVEILAIAQDDSGKIWLGTLGSGLFSMDMATGQFRQFKSDPRNADALPSDVVTRIYARSSGEMWLTTWNGLSRFNPSSGSFTTYKRDKASSAELYFSIVPDGVGNFWLGTTGGLYKFSPVTSEFKAYVHDLRDFASLSNNTVNSILVESPAVVWVGTQNGLSRLDTNSGEFFSFFERHGLAGNAVSCLLQDDDGSIWMSTNRGVSRLDVATATFENYATSDGLPGLDLTGWNACARGADNRLYFGGFSGAALKTKGYDVGKTNDAPAVVFTQIQAGTSPVMPAAGLADNKVQAITIPYSDSQLTVTFSALSYKRPDNTRYRYMLEGVDTDWHSTFRNQRSLSFATLPTGTFKLLIQATTTQRTWNGPIAKIEVTVLPPWWRTRWFYGLFFSLMAITVIAIYRMRISQIAADYRIRLDERSAERSRVARELHDTLLQSFQGLIFQLYAARAVLAKEPDEAARMMDVILEKSDDAMIEGRQVIEMLREDGSKKDLVDMVRMIGEDLATNVKPSPRFELLSSGSPYDLDPKVHDEVYKIVVEALRNAYNHSAANLVSCTFVYKPGTMLVQVRDDGVGFRPSGDDRQFKRWGVEGMKERANRIGGHLMIESLSGHGTTIELAVPVRRAFSALRFNRAGV